jgi:hypothetical protein
MIFYAKETGICDSCDKDTYLIIFKGEHQKEKSGFCYECAKELSNVIKLGLAVKPQN